MLRSDIGPTDKLDLRAHGFLMGLELEHDTDLDALMNGFADYLMAQPGVGAVECEYLGEIEVLEMNSPAQSPLPFKES